MRREHERFNDVKFDFNPTPINTNFNKIKDKYQDSNLIKDQARKDIERTCSRLEAIGIKGKADEIRNNIKF